MNGCIVKAKRKKVGETYSIRLDLGPKPGGGRLQKAITVRGTREQAEVRLRGILAQFDRGEFIEPSRTTVLEWLLEWLEATIRPQLAHATHATYANAIKTHITGSMLGATRLQRLRKMDIERYLAELPLSNGARQIHRTTLSSALRSAVDNGLLRVNPAIGAKLPRSRFADEAVTRLDG